MKRMLVSFIALALSPVAAHAWDGQPLWYNPANGGNGQPGVMGALMPGGGGIIGTGGARDYGITCANCHLNDKKQQGAITLTFRFTPALPSVGGATAYVPNQRYAVTATLVGEHLGQTGCGPYVTGNINNFAASIEDGSGKTAGVMASDSGQTATSCPARTPTVSSGTTMMYGDCHAVFSMGGDKADANRTSWNFTWTAPPAGSGPLTIYWGVVDGDCAMDSLGDDVKAGNTKLVEGTAALHRPRSRGARQREFAWLESSLSSPPSSARSPRPPSAARPAATRPASSP